MLKVTDFEVTEPVNIEYDVYTPINIEFGTWNISKEPTLYWRTGNFKKSIIEIGLWKYTGSIRSITLTLSEDVSMVESLILERKNINVIKGKPKFYIEDYSDMTYVDEKGSLKVLIGIDNVLISLSENVPESVIQNDNVGFVLDKNKIICGIMVSDMLKREKNILENALKNWCDNITDALILVKQFLSKLERIALNV